MPLALSIPCPVSNAAASAYWASQADENGATKKENNHSGTWNTPLKTNSRKTIIWKIYSDIYIYIYYYLIKTGVFPLPSYFTQSTVGFLLGKSCWFSFARNPSDRLWWEPKNPTEIHLPMFNPSTPKKEFVWGSALFGHEESGRLADSTTKLVSANRTYFPWFVVKSTCDFVGQRLCISKLCCSLQERKVHDCTNILWCFKILHWCHCWSSTLKIHISSPNYQNTWGNKHWMAFSKLAKVLGITVSSIPRLWICWFKNWTCGGPRVSGWNITAILN